MRRAFTLLEVLLATLLFGLLSTLVYGLLNQGLRRSRNLASQTVRQHQGQVLQALLQTDLLTSGPVGCLLEDTSAAIVPLSQVDSGGNVHWANRLVLYLFQNETLQRHELTPERADLSALELGRVQPPKLTAATLSPVQASVRSWRSAHHWSDLKEWKLTAVSGDGAMNYRLHAVFQYGRQQEVIDVLLW